MDNWTEVSEWNINTGQSVNAVHVHMYTGRIFRYNINLYELQLELLPCFQSKKSQCHFVKQEFLHHYLAASM